VDRPSARLAESNSQEAVRRRRRNGPFGRTKQLELAEPDTKNALNSASGARQVRFNGGWYDTAIFDRASLGRGAELAGPAIVEQPDTTVVIDPGATAVVDGLGNLVISVGET
jgi:N-methylhydantoinase A